MSLHEFAIFIFLFFTPASQVQNVPEMTAHLMWNAIIVGIFILVYNFRDSLADMMVATK